MSSADSIADLSMLDALPLAIIVFDGQDRMVLANQRMLALAGVESRRLAPGITLDETVRLFALRGLYGPGDPEQQVVDTLALDRSRPYRRMLRHADGTTLELRVQPMSGGGFIACLMDVSHLAEPLQTAMADLRQLETLFDALGSGVALYDRDEKLLLRNTQYAQLIGLPASRVNPGMNAEELFGRLVEHGEMQPGDARAWLAGTRHDAAQGSVVQDRLRPGGQSVRFRRARLTDGSRLVEVSDVTALRNAEADARRRATLLDAILSALPVGVLVWGADHRARFVNAAYSRIMADSPVAIGDHMADVARRRGAAGEFGDVSTDAMVTMLHDQAHLPQSFERQRPNGDMISIRREPLADGGHVSVLNDITDLHRARAEATARAEMLNIMLESMQHGIALYGEDGRVRAVNRLARELCGLTEEEFRPGAHMAELRNMQIARGEYGDAEQTAAFLARRPNVQWHGPDRYVRARPNGQVVEFVTLPAAGGGFVRTFSDITALHTAEAHAAQRAEMLNTMLEGMRHGIALFDENGTVLAVNRLACEMCNLTTEEFRPGASMPALRDVQIARGEYGDAEQTAAFLARRPVAMWTGPDRYIRVRPNGQVVEVVTVPAEGGAFVRTYADITALHEAEASAAQRASTVSTMLEGIRHGLAMYGPDARLIAANSLAESMSGVAGLHQRTGITLTEVLAEQQADGGLGPDPDGAAMMRWQQGLDRTRSHVFQRALPDGRVFEVVSDPTPDGGFIIAVSDVTRLVEAEAKAQRRSEVLAAMLENIRHGICLFDENERVLATNARFQQIIGMRAEAVAPGTPFRDFVAELLAIGEFGEGEAAAAIAAERLARDRLQPWRTLRQRPGGGWVEIVSDPIPGGGFVLTFTDVTEENEARAAIDAARRQAEAASAAKSRFLATMSHELRTPLTAVIGFAETLQLSPNAPNREEYISAIRDAGRHLLTLINDILDVASAEAGGVSVREERVEPAPLMAEVLRVMQAAGNASGVRLMLDAAPGLPDLRADGMRLRQVLLNLLSNAVKFTLSGGEVRLSGRALEDGGLEIEVRDNGIGMPEADIPRAFEPFSQLDSGAARKFEGSGIGLSLSRALAEAQGASLSLRSRPGEGTRAILRFPAERLYQIERTAK